MLRRCTATRCSCHVLPLKSVREASSCSSGPRGRGLPLLHWDAGFGLRQLPRLQEMAPPGFGSGAPPGFGGGAPPGFDSPKAAGVSALEADLDLPPGFSGDAAARGPPGFPRRLPAGSETRVGARLSSAVLMPSEVEGLPLWVGLKGSQAGSVGVVSSSSGLVVLLNSCSVRVVCIAR